MLVEVYYSSWCEMTSVDEVWSEVCGVNGGVLFLLMWDDISRRGLIWGLWMYQDPALSCWSLSQDRCCSDRSLLESVVMEILPPVAWRNMKTQTEALTSYETPANEYFTFVSQVYKLLEPARDIFAHLRHICARSLKHVRRKLLLILHISHNPRY